MKGCQYIHHKLETLRNKHPYDLSGGEQQLLGLSKILKNNPQIVFLDEPTKGIDPVIRDDIIEFIKKLKKEGKTIVIVTHNVDFAANCADRCALIFNGRIVAVENRKRFFAGNNFYTTVANKISRDVFANVVTLDELISRCEKGKKNDYN
jgi:energy-coupling factor transport system ATP-binding protein